MRMLAPLLLLCSLPTNALPQSLKFLPTDGVAKDRFGTSVALDGDTVLVGAPFDDDGAEASGSAYLFDRVTGTQTAKLVAPDPASQDAFGYSVSLSGNLALVGVPSDDDHGQNSGSAHLFDVSTGAWIAKFLPSDGATEDWFGQSVGISGTTAIVGAGHADPLGWDSGAAYLFDTVSGVQVAKLLPADAGWRHEFGCSVAISGSTAIVGAWAHGPTGQGAGAAYLFNTTTGAQLAKLLATDAAAGDRFGEQVSISGNLAIIGAPGADPSGLYSGAAYLFDTLTGNQVAKLEPHDTGPKLFGGSVAISGSSAIVGAKADDTNGVFAGAAYLFDTASGIQLSKLLPADGAAQDDFGLSVGIGSAGAVCGAQRDDDNGTNSGSAYVFETTIALENTGTAFCFGDGTGATCPCAATGNAGEGCANTTGAGATLTASGHASFTQDGFQLHVAGVPGSKPGLVLRGNNAVAIPAGDGILCASGASQRSHVQITVLGATSYTDFDGGTFAAVANVGSATRYQFWYRDPSNPCSGAGFNFTNGWTVVWIP